MGGASTFVVLRTTPSPAKADAGGWVHSVDYDPELPGWGIHLGYADELDLEVRFEDGPPAVEQSATAVVEVSCEGPMHFANDDTGEEVAVPTQGDQSHRVRLSIWHTPHEHPRLLAQAWPAAATAPLVVKERESTPSDLSLPEAAEGLAAAARIGADIDRRTQFTLDDLTGVATAEVTVSGEAKRLFPYFDQARSWVPSHDDFMWKSTRFFDGPTTYMRDANHPDRLSGTTGAIWSTVHPADDPPHRMTLWWNWLVVDSERRYDSFAAFRQAQLRGNESATPRKYLPRDGIRTVILTDDPTAPGNVVVRVEHTGLPLSWADDMARWNTYQLAILASDPVPI